MKIHTCKRCGFQGDVFQLSAHDCIVKNSDPVQRELERLWFIYGNGGPKSTMEDHKFLQRHVEGRGHLARFFKASKECRKAVKAALQRTAE